MAVLFGASTFSNPQLPQQPPPITLSGNAPDCHAVGASGGNCAPRQKVSNISPIPGVSGLTTTSSLPLFARADITNLPTDPGDSATLHGTAASLTPSAPGKDVTTFLQPVVSPATFVVPVVPNEPLKPAEHRFFDRQNLLGLAIHSAVRIADSAQSCILLARGGRRESWLPTQSCAAITGYSLSMVGAQVLSSYGLHRMGHHTLERYAPYLWAAPSAAGIAVSIKAW